MRFWAASSRDARAEAATRCLFWPLLRPTYGDDRRSCALTGLKPLSAIGEHPTLRRDGRCGPRLNGGYAMILKMVKARSKRTICGRPQIGLDDVAVMGQPVKERRTHLHHAEDVTSFGKRHVGGGQHARAFVELAEQVKQQRTPRLTKW